MTSLVTKRIPSRETSRRLMIVLHGLGDSMAGYQWLPGILALPQMNYLLVNAPDPYYGGYSWYDFAGNPEIGVLRSRGLISELLQSQETAGFPPEETFLFGFSQGCLITLDAGLRHPRKLGGLIGISGYVHDPERLLKELSPAAKEQRILLTHGTEDPILSISLVRNQYEMLKKAGLNIHYVEFAKAHTIAGEAEIELIRKFVIR